MHLSILLPVVALAITIMTSPVLAQQMLSKEGKFTIELSWDPAMLEPDIPINFVIRFKDPGSDIFIPHVDWTMTIRNEGTVVAEFSDHTMFGIVDFKNEGKSFAFDKTGNFEILIEAEQTETGMKEDATFVISVVPEFPTGIALITSFALFSIILIHKFQYKYKSKAVH